MQTLTITQVGPSSSRDDRAHRATVEAKELTARHLLIAARASLGFIVFMQGLNGFLHVLPHATEPLVSGRFAFTSVLLSLPAVNLVAVGIGALLLTNRFVPLALVLLAPLVADLVLVHVFIAPERLSMAVVALGLELYLAWAYRDAYRPMFAMRAGPVRSDLHSY
jgi:hypothetical protein